MLRNDNPQGHGGPLRRASSSADAVLERGELQLPDGLLADGDARLHASVLQIVHREVLDRRDEAFEQRA